MGSPAFGSRERRAARRYDLSLPTLVLVVPHRGATATRDRHDLVWRLPHSVFERQTIVVFTQSRSRSFRRTLIATAGSHVAPVGTTLILLFPVPDGIVHAEVVRNVVPGEGMSVEFTKLNTARPHFAGTIAKAAAALGCTACPVRQLLLLPSTIATRLARWRTY
jgi:hypothetical protein